MAEKTVNLKGADELHINQDPKKGTKGGVFFILHKKAYYADGRPVEPDRLWICQHCQHSPPFFAEREIDFAKHIIKEHPEHAKGKTPEAREAEEKAVAAEKADAALKAAAKKAKAAKKSPKKK